MEQDIVPCIIAVYSNPQQALARVTLMKCSHALQAILDRLTVKLMLAQALRDQRKHIVALVDWLIVDPRTQCIPMMLHVRMQHS